MHSLKLTDHAASNIAMPTDAVSHANLRYLKLFFLIASLLLSSTSFAADFDTREYTLKGVFLERFTRFIDWPKDEAGNTNNNSFIISIVGNPEFSSLLKDIYQNQTIQGKTVLIKDIKDINDIEELQNTHLLFIADTADIALANILQQTENSPILTVSDVNGFAKKGVMINFFMSSKQKIRFEINELAIKKSELYISYKLLSVAKIV